VSLSVRLTGDRIFANAYRPEAMRMLDYVRRQIQLAGIDSFQLRRTYPLGVTITAKKFFDTEIILIEAPPVQVREFAEEVLYYLRFGMLQSLLEVPHHYQFFRIRGRGLPPSELHEIEVDGTSSKYLQTPYWLQDNRKHKRTESGKVILFPGLGNTSFGGGTVDAPETWFDWSPYETSEYFEAWDELLTRQSTNYTEDGSGWSDDAGVYTYTKTRPYTFSWGDESGPHSTSSFEEDTEVASDEATKVGDTYPSGSHDEGTLDCSREIKHIFGSEADFDAETINLFNWAVGNRKLHRICYDVLLTCQGSFSRDWVDTGGGHMHITSTVTQDICALGSVKILFGDTEVDSGAWDITTHHEGTDTHHEGETGDGTGSAVGTESLFRLLNFTNIEDQVFAAFYKKSVRVSNKSFATTFYPASTVRDLGSLPFPTYATQAVTRYNVTAAPGGMTGTVDLTNDYYLAFKTPSGLVKVLLASHTIAEVMDPYSKTITGTRIGQTFASINEKFILYAYSLQTFSGGSWADSSFHYGVISLAGGQRKEYSYQPAEMSGAPVPFDLYMYIPGEREKQP
jgi:hypothetical protein